MPASAAGAAGRVAEAVGALSGGDSPAPVTVPAVPAGRRTGGAARLPAPARGTDARPPGRLRPLRHRAPGAPYSPVCPTCSTAGAAAPVRWSPGRATSSRVRRGRRATAHRRRAAPRA
ncbi:hypothetical protein ACE1SV_03610 [Streptomyces sp. E-15]